MAPSAAKIADRLFSIVFDYFRVSVVTNRWVMTRRNAALSFEFFLSSQTPKLKYIVGGTIKFYSFFVVFVSFRFSVDGFCWFITPLSCMFSTSCLCTNHSPPFVFARLLLSLHQSPLLKERLLPWYSFTEPPDILMRDLNRLDCSNSPQEGSRFNTGASVRASVSKTKTGVKDWRKTRKLLNTGVCERVGDGEKLKDVTSTYQQEKPHGNHCSQSDSPENWLKICVCPLNT